MTHVEYTMSCGELDGVSSRVYHESIKREIKTRPIYECRCDERLKAKHEESTLLTSTLLCAEVEHLKIETRLINATLPSEMGEYVCVM